MAETNDAPSETFETAERRELVAHVLRYELYRHRDISERLAQRLGVDDNPDAFNRSTWDILYYLIQSHLQSFVPTVTDIYLSTNLSKGTAISGLAELERRGAIAKVRDNEDGRRRLITISEMVAEIVGVFVTECGDRLGTPLSVTHAMSPTPATDLNENDDPLIALLTQLSRELRTPLTAILGFSEMIADETLGPVQPVGYAEYARDIRRAAANLLDSMNDLVDTTLADHGVGIELTAKSAVDVQTLVDAACRIASADAEKRGVTVRRKWGKVHGPIMGDEARLSQAFRKLIVATASAARRDQIVDVETGTDSENNITIRVISPDSPVASPRNSADMPIGSPETDDLIRSLPLIQAIVTAHSGSIAGEQLGTSKYVTTVRLPHRA